MSGQTWLLVTSNGTGMGHLSRQLSVALAAPAGTRPVVFSLSLGLPLVLEYVEGEYCPSYEREWMPPQSWNSYLRDRLEAIIHEVGADVVLFDGVAPYPGILNARPLVPDTAFVWQRRAMWRAGVGAKQIKRSGIFDLIIEPGDLGSDADSGLTVGRDDAVAVPPVSMLEVVPRLPRAEAAGALGLDPARPTMLVTLGSGRLGEVAAPGTAAVRAALAHPEWQVAVTTSAIASMEIPVGEQERVVELRGVFPLVRYLEAFDAAVSAAGYNAVHELVSNGLPTVLVPNAATRTDDQVGRARAIAERGMALVAASSSDVDREVGVLMGDDVRETMRRTILATPASHRMGGAAAAGRHLAGLASSFSPSTRLRVAQTLRTADLRVREAAKNALGPGGTAVVRRILGRPSYDGIAADLSVTIVNDPAGVPQGSSHPLWLTRSVREMRAGGDPVEHLLAGSSDDYESRRRRIIDRYYNVVADQSSR